MLAITSQWTFFSCFYAAFQDKNLTKWDSFLFVNKHQIVLTLIKKKSKSKAFRDLCSAVVGDVRRTGCAIEIVSLRSKASGWYSCQSYVHITVMVSGQCFINFSLSLKKGISN